LLYQDRVEHGEDSEKQDDRQPYQPNGVFSESTSVARKTAPQQKKAHPV
jgi:hypothetical protein